MSWLLARDRFGSMAAPEASQLWVVTDMWEHAGVFEWTDESAGKCCCKRISAPTGEIRALSPASAGML